MSKFIGFFAAAAAAAAAGNSAAAESTRDNGWQTTFWVGPDWPLSGDLQPSTSAAIANLGAIDPALAGDAGSATLDHLSFRDAFRAGPALGFELSYGTGDRFTPFARLRYSDLRGRDTTIGSIESPALGAAAPLEANFDSMKSIAFDVGGRYAFSDLGSWQPFFSGYLGLTHSRALRATISAPTLPYSITDAMLIPAGTRLGAGLEGGVSYHVTPSADLRFAVGADYLGSRHWDSDALQSLGIDALHFAGQRWSIPADIGLTYRF